MSSVFDSSAVLAILRDEVAAEFFLQLLPTAWISNVNLIEVLSKLDDLEGRRPEEADGLLDLLAGVRPFTERQARHAAALRAQTPSAGLSLGDRSCIALAVELGAEVYTADRAWAQVKLPCPVHLVR